MLSLDVPLRSVLSGVRRLWATSLLLTGVLSYRAEALPLWELKRAQGSVFLLGAVHLMRAEDVPYPTVLDEIFEDATRVVVEADVEESKSEPRQQQLAGLAVNAAGDLGSRLDAETLEGVRSFAAANGIQLVEFYQPWFLSSLITLTEMTRGGFSEDFGPDSYYLARARRLQKRVVFLETVDFQFALLSGATPEAQIRTLTSTWRGVDTIASSAGALADAWKAPSVSGFEERVRREEADDPAEFHRLVTSRNAQWVPKIEALLSQPGSSMVIVGAAHLFGPEGVVNLLRRRGHSVELYPVSAASTPMLRLTSLRSVSPATAELTMEVSTDRWYSLERRGAGGWTREATFYASNVVTRFTVPITGDAGLFRLRTPPAGAAIP